MTAEFLAFRSPVQAAPPAPRRSAPFDPGYAALSLLTRLRETLTAAARLVAECRTRHARTRGRWGEPPLFFFDRAVAVPPPPAFPQPYLTELAPRLPAEALAWAKLPDLFDDVLTLLPASVGMRRAARAIDRLGELAGELAPVLPPAKELSELLAVPDDQVVLAVHPASRTGVRVLLRGVAEVNQLHVLLADTLPGPRPDPRLVDACLDARPDPAAAVFFARWQLFRPSALRPDGTLPSGFGGSDHWVWGHQSPAELPLERGERVVLLGEPTYRAGWEVGRKFPRLPGEVEVLDHLTAADVSDWLAERCPRLAAQPRVRAAA